MFLVISGDRKSAANATIIIYNKVLIPISSRGLVKFLNAKTATDGSTE